MEDSLRQFFGRFNFNLDKLKDGLMEWEADGVKSEIAYKRWSGRRWKEEFLYKSRLSNVSVVGM